MDTRSSHGRMFFLSLFLVTLTAVFSISCVHTKKNVLDTGARPVYITDTLMYEYLDPSCIDTPVDCLQRIDGSFGEQEFSFLTYTQADATKIELIVLSDLGTEIANILYRDKKITLSGLVVAKKIPAEYIIADFQLAYYRVACLNQFLNPYGVTVDEGVLENGRTYREIFAENNAILHIEYETDVLYFTNTLRGYSYTIYSGDRL